VVCIRLFIIRLSFPLSLSMVSHGRCMGNAS